jgi:hypothetical protein
MFIQIVTLQKHIFVTKILISYIFVIDKLEMNKFLLVKLADMACKKLLPDLKFDSSRHCRFKMGVMKSGVP